MIEDQCFKLRSGALIPKVGLGTWKAPQEKTFDAVEAAIRSGYRMVDCANDYDNEHVIGEVLKKMFAEGVVTRDQLFIQAKLWNSNHRPEHVKADLMATLADLQLDYVDSFVIHWPQAVPATGKGEALLRNGGCYPAPASQGTMFPCDEEGYYCSDNESHYLETWAAMEALVDEGLCKSIGLSNFNKTQVQEVLQNAAKHLPSVLQNECHPYLQEKDLIDFCRNNQIIFQSYSPLGSGDRPWLKTGSITSGPTATGYEILEDPRIVKIAEKYSKTTAQCIIRWHMQRGCSCVPKSVTPSRVESNYQVHDFELSAEDMEVFNEFNIGWRHLVWAETSMHPDYPFKDWLPYNYQIGKPGAGSSAGATD